jgi:hypothetical protein
MIQEIPLFSIMIEVGFLFSFIWIVLQDFNLIHRFVLLLVVGYIFGFVLGILIYDFNFTLPLPQSSMGSMLGISIFISIFKSFNINIYVLGFIIPQIFGRIGCIEANCCPSLEIYNIELSHLIEIIFYLINIFLWFKYKYTLSTYIIMYLILRFFIDFLRMDDQPLIAHLSIGQITILVSLLVFYYTNRITQIRT